MAVSASDLTKLYLAYFGRPPDFDGMQFYTSAANANLTIAQVAAGFSASPESQALYGSTSLAGMIDNIYQNIFGRPADVSGLQFWSDAINTGKVTPALAAYNILTGALLLNNADGAVVLNKLAIATAWTAALDTNAEIVGYTGATAASTARAFLSTVDGTPASLAAHSGAALDAAINAAINAQGQITATVNAPTVTEGDSGTKVLAFTITLDKAPTVPLTLNFSATGGTAVANDDFTATSGAVVFAAGQTTATVNVTVLGDTTFEGNETVVLTLTGALANFNGTATGTGTIVDDDPTPAQLSYVASVSAPVVDEGNSGTTTLAFVITLDHAAVGPVTVNYQTLITGTATAGTDYISQAGTIVFANGQQSAVVNVVVNGDVTVENSETIVLQVTGTQLSNSGVVSTGTITNDDVEPLLTQQIDNIVVQGTGANTIKGIVDGTTPANNTFSIGDHIVGNGMTVLELDVAATGTGAFAYVDNVSAINVVAGAAGPITFNAIQWTNIGAINLAAGVNGMTVNVSNLETGVDLGIGASVGGQLAVTYQDNDFVNLFNFGKGGASFDADGGSVQITMGNAVPQFTNQSAGLVIASSNDITLADVAITGGADNAAAVLSASASGDVTINGDITLSVGDATTTSALDTIFVGAGGNIDINGAIVEIAGSSASALLTLSASGNVSVSSIGQNVGPSGVAVVAVGAGGAVNIGGIAQSGATGAFESVSVSASSDINVGGLTQLGGVSALAYVHGGGNVDVGNVSQSASSFASFTASASGSGDVTIGNIAQGVASSNVFLGVYANGGDIDLGLISQNFATTATVSVTNTSGGDIDIAGISQIGGSGSALVNATATSSGDVTIGDIYQSMTSGGYMSVTVNASGTGVIDVGDITQTGLTSASAWIGIYGNDDVTVGDINVAIGDATATSWWARVSISASGDLTVGDVSVSAGDGASMLASVTLENNTGHDLSAGNISVAVGDETTTATNFAYIGVFNSNATGDLSVGNVEMDLGLTASGTISIDQSGTTGFDGGSLTVGNIVVNLADKAILNDLLIQNTQTATTTTTTDLGDLTVGDITFNMGTNASASVDISQQLWGTGSGDIGDVMIGNVVVDADVNAWFSWDLTVSNTATGDVGNVTIGDVSIVMNDGGSMSWSVNISASNGDVGDVTVGNIDIELGVSGSMFTLWFDIDGHNVGDVSFGNVNVDIGQYGTATDGFSLSVSASSGDIGMISVGGFNIHVGQSADYDSNSFDITATGDIGGFSLGDMTLTIDASGSFGTMVDMDMDAGGNIGDISFGNVQGNLSASGAYMSQFYDVSIDADNVGNITIGNINVNLGTSASRTDTSSFDVSATDSIGNISIGNIVYNLTGNGANTSSGFSFSFSASAGSIGDITIGDIVMNVASSVTGASFTSTWSFDFYAATGIGDIMIGNIDLSGHLASDSLDLSITVSNDTSGDIGNLTIGNVHASISSSYDASVSINVTNTVGAIGDVTIGNVDVTALADSSASALAYFDLSADTIGNVRFGNLSVMSTAGAYAQISASIDAATGDIGDVTIGNVSGVATGTSWASVTVAMTAAGAMGDISIGNVDATVTTGNVSLDFDFSATTFGDVDIGNINMMATGSGFATFNVQFNNGSLTGALDIGDITFAGTVSSTLNVVIGGDSADVSIGTITVNGSGVFGSDYNLTITGDTMFIDTVNVSVSGTAAQYSLTGILSGLSYNTLTIDTVTYANYVMTATNSMTIDVSAFTVNNVIGSDYNDTIIVGEDPVVIEGGAGTDNFDVTFGAAQNWTTSSTAALTMYTITDFAEGNTSNETIATGANNFNVSRYAEKSAADFNAAALVALDTMSDPTLQSDIVAVKVGGDTYVFVDQDGGNDIDLVVKLVGVDTAKLNFADFTS